MVVEIPPRAAEAIKSVGGRRGRKASSCEVPDRVGEWTPAAKEASQRTNEACERSSRTAGRLDVETATLASNLLRVGMREASDSSGELGIGRGLGRDLGESGRGAFDSEVGRYGLVKVEQAGGLGLRGEALEMAVVRERSRRVAGTVS